MAKAKKLDELSEENETQESQTATSFPTYAVPEGYEERDSSVDGTWHPDMGPIHFIPLSASLFDGKIDAHKPSAIILGKLVDARELDVTVGERAPGEPRDLVEFPKGATVGIFAKPGMAGLRDLAGVKVFMYMNGEMNTGKKNPMKTFSISSMNTGTPIPITRDSRKKSKHASIWLMPEQETKRKTVPDDEI